MALTDRQTFPTYVYHEYPKYVTSPTGKAVIVASEYEEQLLLRPNTDNSVVPVVEATENIVEITVPDFGSTTSATPLIAIPDEAPDAELATEEDKSELIERAEELGIIYKKSWGILRLKEAINAAQAKL